MKKKKNRKILAITTALSMIAISGGVVYGYTEYQKPQVAKAVNYNDEEYVITLTANELNNYTYTNLQIYLEEASNNATIITAIQNTSISYNQNTYQFNDISDYLQYRYIVEEDSESYSISYGILEESVAEEEYCKFSLMHVYNGETEEETLQFTNDININLNATIYNDFKSAIELDIAANQQQNDMGSSIIESITSGLGIITDLAHEFLNGFTTLFWNSTNSTLTNFGIFALVMLGVAISFAVIRLIMNLIRGNTGV